MAEYLASIYGTEKDKLGHADMTVLVANMVHVFDNENTEDRLKWTRYKKEELITPIYEDIFRQLAEYGEIKELRICGNKGEHLIGNVYCQFDRETSAAKAVEGLNGRFYDGRPLYAELSPVTDFKEAHCRQEETSERGCDRGGFCNFMHPWEPNPSFKDELMDAQYAMIRNRRREVETKAYSVSGDPQHVPIVHD